MLGPRCLVVFRSRHGNSQHIAEVIARRLRSAGATVDLHDLARSTGGPAGYDLVVVGGAVHLGRHSRDEARWLRRHAAILDRTPCAVFSVSLAAAGSSDEERARARGYLSALLERTGVSAGCTAVFAGALQYESYALPVRWVMRRIARGAGLSTDDSQDEVLTDWAAVEAFADRALAVLPVFAPAA